MQQKVVSPESYVEAMPNKITRLYLYIYVCNIMKKEAMTLRVGGALERFKGGEHGRHWREEKKEVM